MGKYRQNTLKAIPITLGLIGINILMYIISVIISGNIMDIDIRTLLLLGGKYGPLIDQGDWWRLITCNFLHGGLVHIAFNMYALYILGPQIESIFGKIKYLIIYFASGLASSILSYIIQPEVVSIGASGAVFGLFGALLVFAIKERDKIKKGVLSNLAFIIGLNLFIGATMPNIDIYGHVGGIVVGILITIIFMINKKYDI